MCACLAGRRSPNVVGLEAETRALLETRLVIDEGEILHVYPDSLGYWTLGVGRLVDARKGGGISQAESRYLLGNTIREREADVIERWPAVLKLDPVRQVVVMSMAYQLGVDGLAQFSGTLAALWRRDYAAAADGMIKSRWALQTPARVHRLASMMRTGVWV
jgi:lysozyme